MKRAVRWIGIGITAAAAASLLLADVLLAATPPETPPYAMVRFDLLSPLGGQCQAAGSARDAQRDLIGRPYLSGLPVDTAVVCTTADGRSFGVKTLRDPRDPQALKVDLIIVDRPGRPVPLLMVQANTQEDPLPVRGNATSLTPVVR